jgi:hypothetical protein
MRCIRHRLLEDIDVFKQLNHMFLQFSYPKLDMKKETWTVIPSFYEKNDTVIRIMAIHLFSSQGTHAVTEPILAGTNITVGSEFYTVSTSKHIQITILFSQGIKHVLMECVLEQFVEQNPIVWDLSCQKVVIHQEGF